MIPAPHLFIMLSAVATAQGQSCAPYWRAGPPEGIYNFADFDDGSGSTVYVAKAYPPRVYRWEGNGFALMPMTGLPASVWGGGPMRVLDDGTGPALYYLLRVTSTAPAAFKWTGSAWMTMPAEFFTMQVEPFASVDLGNGPEIYGRPWATTNNYGIYKWTGSAWSLLATMNSKNIAGLFGHGGDLYMIGGFSNVGGVPNTGVVRYDGQQWHAIPGVRGENAAGSGWWSLTTVPGPRCT